MRKLVYLCKLVLAFNLGVLVACLAGCTMTVDGYWPSKRGNAAERQIVHDRVQGQSDLEYFQAWQADQQAAARRAK